MLLFPGKSPLITFVWIFQNVVWCCGVILEIHLGGGKKRSPDISNITRHSVGCHCKKSHKPTSNHRFRKLWFWLRLHWRWSGQKRVGGNIGPQARQPLPGALHKKRREWGREGQGISEAESGTNSGKIPFQTEVAPQRIQNRVWQIHLNIWIY